MFSTMTIRCNALALAAACLSPICIAAEQPAERILDEIVVTADYRERPLLDIPTSLSVFGAGTIDDTTIQHFEELVGQVPNMNWSGDGHRGRYFQIRGVGELAQYQGAPNPSVGFLVDDIDFSGIGSIATLYDIERIEVLRGPQGTRYGANALGGLIYVQSTEPVRSFAGQLRLTAADDEAFGIGAALGGPLGQRAAYRLSGHRYQANGFRDNPYLGRDDTNGRDETTLRGKLAFDLGDHWRFRLAAMYADIDDGYDAFAIDNSLTVLSDKPGTDAQRSRGASLRAAWTGAGTFEFTSITSIADSAIVFGFDADWGNDQAWAPVLYDYVSSNERQRTTLSQELRLASTDDGRLFAGTTDWLVGLYVNRLDEDLRTLITGNYFDPGYNFSDSLDDRLDSRFAATNIALFGQLDTSIGEAGVLGLGLRAERRTTDYTDSSGLDLGPGESMLGGELSYTHFLGEAVSLYVTLARGFKAGGFNLGLVPDGQRAFDQETLWNAEAGLKALLADGALSINTSIFYSIRRDQQVESSFQINPNDPASFVFFTDNAAEGEATGVEAEIRWMPLDSLKLYANLGYLRARFMTFDDPLLDLAGRDQAHAPRYTIAAGGEYRHASGLFLRVDVSGKDAFYFDVSHDQRSDDYAIASLRLGYEAERWSAQLFANNLFDETYAVRGFYFGNEPPDFPPTLYTRHGDPRQLGVIFEMRFDE